MSLITLHRRDKAKLPKGCHIYFNGLFIIQEKEESPSKEVEKERKARVKEVKAYLSKAKIGSFKDDDIAFAVRTPFSDRKVKGAQDLLALVRETEDRTLRDYDPYVELKGAINHKNVTCYLDTLFFALFLRLQSFEVMLTRQFDNEKKNRLAALLRLWVNAQRSGKLITIDITKQIQDALTDCGWDEVGSSQTRQQDVGEAFCFIAEQLELPNLSFQMDIFHSGKEDKDDHKIVQERLLEVPVLEPEEEGGTVTIEKCFEEALNAKVEIKRDLEGRERQMTGDSSASSVASPTTLEKRQLFHIENADEQVASPSTPTSESVNSPLPPYSPSQRPPTRRTQSIVQERYVDEKAELRRLDREYYGGGDSSGEKLDRVRTGSLRKEILMPAWQMYRLIPFQSNEVPNTDAEVARHLAERQPTFGVRLKRYSMDSAGKLVRRNTKVDISIDMAVPSFVHDQSVGRGVGAFGNFKLSLQSVICHRGTTIESGHYVALVRGKKINGEDQWLLCDDLAEDKVRVRRVDINDALKKEMPYLLFYQVQPLEPQPGDRTPRSVSSEGVPGRPSRSPDRTDSNLALGEDMSTAKTLASMITRGRRARRSSSQPRPTSAIFFRSDSGTNIDTLASTNPPSGVQSKRNSIIGHSTSTKKTQATLASAAAASKGSLSDSGSPRNSLSLSRFAGKLAGLKRADDSSSDAKRTASVPAGHGNAKDGSVNSSSPSSSRVDITERLKSSSTISVTANRPSIEVTREGRSRSPPPAYDAPSRDHRPSNSGAAVMNPPQQPSGRASLEVPPSISTSNVDSTDATTLTTTISNTTVATDFSAPDAPPPAQSQPSTLKKPHSKSSSHSPAAGRTSGPKAPPPAMSEVVEALAAANAADKGKEKKEKNFLHKRGSVRSAQAVVREGLKEWRERESARELDRLPRLDKARERVRTADADEKARRRLSAPPGVLMRRSTLESEGGAGGTDDEAEAGKAAGKITKERPDRECKVM